MSNEAAPENFPSSPTASGTDGAQKTDHGLEYRSCQIPTLHQWRRESSEAIIGGVTGSLRRPNVLLLGRYDTTGRLRLVGKTVPLKAAAAQEVAALLTPAGPDHPWTGARFSARWGSRDLLDPVLVEPDHVAEVSADTAQEHGVGRHPVRYVRIRRDLPPAQVRKLDADRGRPA
ncbi:hypothetical protein [Streptomyces sp. 2131.1]|uniref:ATP dependent DNA ligase n=1 Tax=Streptomyces sp. 2131.1 TaxID=1855346 RepID=UPI000B844FC7|nr:hypothetical protein [Streptomyces sp. 2131.1]